MALVSYDPALILLTICNGLLAGMPRVCAELSEPLGIVMPCDSDVAMLSNSYVKELSERLCNSDVVRSFLRQ